MQKNFPQKIKNALKRLPFVATHGKALRRLAKPLALYLTSKSTSPLSDRYGLDRGTPIDRFYIEAFLARNQSRVAGACLEVLENAYTKKFGGDKVTLSEALDIDPNNKGATIVADIRSMSNVTSDTYDCIILTQVLQFIDDPSAALEEVHRVLKPGGYALVTLPAISRIDCTSGVDGDFWRFTEAGARELFRGFETADVASLGNCRSGMLFLAGAAQEDVSHKVLSVHDRQFPVIITVSARKSP